jgi:hypothetical protein
MFYRSLCPFFWSLCCLSFDLQLLIITLVCGRTSRNICYHVKKWWIIIDVAFAWKNIDFKLSSSSIYEFLLLLWCLQTILNVLPTIWMLHLLTAMLSHEMMTLLLHLRNNRYGNVYNALNYSSSYFVTYPDDGHFVSYLTMVIS